MPRYQYTAIAAGGKKIKGAVTAESPYAARKQLRVRNIHPSSIKEISTKEKSGADLLSRITKRNKNQIIEFTKQMATLLNSGIKLTDSLSVLSMQINDARFKNAVIDIRDRVVTGESFTDAIKDYGDYFDVIYVSMVRVGDMTGTLGTEPYDNCQLYGKTPQGRIENYHRDDLSDSACFLLFLRGFISNDLCYPQNRGPDSPGRPGIALDYTKIDGFQRHRGKLEDYYSYSCDCL